MRNIKNMEQEIFMYGETVYVTAKFLKRYNIAESTIHNHTATKNHSNKKWYSTKHPWDKKRLLIAYNSLPLELIQEKKLPDFHEIKEFYQIELSKIKKIIDYTKYNHIKNCLDYEYSHWEDIKETYQNEFLEDEKLEMFCKTYAIFSRIIDLVELGQKLIKIYQVYTFYNDLVFSTESYHSFCNKIKKIRKAQCLEDEIFHGLRGLPSNNLKMGEDVIIEIINHFLNPKKLNAGQILENVNKYLIVTNRKQISLPSIYRIISQNYVQNVVAISRHGYKYAKDNLIPFAHFDLPQSEGILWLMDGSRFQFAYRSDNSKFKFLTFFVIMDGRTKEIISYSYDTSENAYMVKKALEIACLKTKYLPIEIISDNSPAFKSEELVRFQANAKIMGSNWRKIGRSNPSDNSYVERFFGVFQESFCKKYDGYIGDGIKSKNLNGKPSYEEIKRYLQNKNLKEKDEIISLLHDLIKEYNQSAKRKSLIEKDDLLIKANPKIKLEPICLSTINYSQLFWFQKEIKVIDGMVSFDFKRENYKYNLNEYETSMQYSRTRVIVRFTPKDFSTIFLFNYKTDDYITKLERTLNIPKVSKERNKDDNKAFNEHVREVKKFKKDLFDGVEKIKKASLKNWEKVPPELAEFGIGTKNEIQESEDNLLSEKLENIYIEANPKAPSDKKQNINLFENFFSGKGDLKVLKHGQN
jgi:transposase InsO family protein